MLLTTSAFESSLIRDRSENPDQGLGLGLAISAEIVRSMGGTTNVENRGEKGSRFTFRVPLKPLPSGKERVAVPKKIGEPEGSPFRS